MKRRSLVKTCASNPSRTSLVWILGLAAALPIAASHGQTAEEAEPGLLQRKLKETIIPRIDFEEATLAEAIDFLRSKSIEHDVLETDPAKKGINIVLLKEANQAAKGRAGHHLVLQGKKLQGDVEHSRVVMHEMAEKHGVHEFRREVSLELLRQAEIRLAEAMHEVETMRCQVRTIQSLDLDELVLWLVAQDGASAIARRYEKYAAMKLDFDALQEKDHPQDKSLAEKLKLAREQLLKEAEMHKRSLGTMLRLEEQKLESASDLRDRVQEEIYDRDRRAAEYNEAKREYERRSQLLDQLRKEELASRFSEREPKPTSTLQLSNIPLADALRYLTLQFGMRMAVDPNALVIGTPEEIAALE